MPHAITDSLRAKFYADYINGETQSDEAYDLELRQFYDGFKKILMPQVRPHSQVPHQLVTQLPSMQSLFQHVTIIALALGQNIFFYHHRLTPPKRISRMFSLIQLTQTNKKRQMIKTILLISPPICLR